MKQTVNKTQFIDAFEDMNRGNSFSYEGKNALFEYLEEYEESTGEEVELDVIALCCEYTEYKNFKEIKENYPDIKNWQDLQDHTQVIKFDGGIIIQDF